MALWYLLNQTRITSFGSATEQFLGEEEGAKLKGTRWNCLNTSVRGCISHPALLEVEETVQIRRNQSWPVLFLPHTTGLAGDGMGISPDRGRPSPLKAKTHSCKSLPSCASKRLLNESNFIITFIINPVRIRWSSVRFVSDLRVCQAMMRVWGSVRWLFYPQLYVYMNLCQQTEPRNLEEVLEGFFGKRRNFGSFVIHSYQFAACLWVVFEWQNLLTAKSAAAPVCLRKWAPCSQYNQLMQNEIT